MLALLLLAALVTAGPPWRRALGLLLAICAAGWSLWLTGSPLHRFLIAIFSFWAAARVLDLARESHALRPAHRLAHVVAFLDTRPLQRVAPTLDVRGFLRGLAWLATSLIAVTLANCQSIGPHGPSGPIGPLRWALGALFVYALAEAANNLAHAVLAALGLKSPPLHRTPIAACSLKEFWGERWNLPVSRWLRAHFFLPLARRRHPILGVALGFLASAGLHAWTVGVALGPMAAASMAGYFAIQGILMALEVRLGVARWTEPAGWAWTMLCVLAPSPLFLEPLLRVFAPASVLV